MNKWSQLQWEFKDLKTSVNFMDLTITTKNNEIHTTLYEKNRNLHLYIPPGSAHPPGLINGIIKGMIYRTNKLCSDKEDRRERLKVFFNHLIRRGWQEHHIKPCSSPNHVLIDLTKVPHFFTLSFTQTTHPPD